MLLVSENEWHLRADLGVNAWPTVGKAKAVFAAQDFLIIMAPEENLFWGTKPVRLIYKNEFFSLGGL